MNAIETFLAIVCGVLLVVAAPFIYDHVVENQDRPEYPYSGFTPDCPTWDIPLDERYLPRPDEDEEVE